MELKNLKSYESFVTEKRSIDELNEANIFTKMITGIKNIIRKSKIGKQVEAYKALIMPLLEEKYRKEMEKELLLSQKTKDQAAISAIDKEIKLKEQKIEVERKKFELQIQTIAKKDPKVTLFAETAKLQLQSEFIDKQMAMDEEYKQNNADNETFQTRIAKRMADRKKNIADLQKKIKDAELQLSKASTEKAIVNVEKDKTYMYTNKDNQDIKVKVIEVENVKNAADGEVDPNLVQVVALNDKGEPEGDEFAVLKGSLRNVPAQAEATGDLNILEKFKEIINKDNTFIMNTAKFVINGKFISKQDNGDEGKWYSGGDLYFKVITCEPESIDFKTDTIFLMPKDGIVKLGEENPIIKQIITGETGKKNWSDGDKVNAIIKKLEEKTITA
jgi:hypothetical protein